MSIEREHYDGLITFICDSCGEIEDTHCSDFPSALQKVKAHGWVVRKEGNDWVHYCRGCK